MITYKGFAPTQNFYPKLLHRQTRRPSLSSQKKPQAIALCYCCSCTAVQYMNLAQSVLCCCTFHHFCQFLPIIIEYQDLPLLLWETAKEQVPCISDHLPCTVALLHLHLPCNATPFCKLYLGAILDCKCYTLMQFF